MNTRFLISTDLDGTLIDHHTYSFDAALPALSRCASLGIPVILNTSKTQAEAEQLQKHIGITGPMVVENGSALVFNATECSAEPKLFGADRKTILEFITHIRTTRKWDFAGFNDWSVDEIAEITGLSLDDAAKANSKRFSEPFDWRDSDQALQDFIQLAEQQGLAVLKGGRFYHLQGKTDKSKPLKWLQQNPHLVFERLETEYETLLIALGDNHNDIAMLNAADIAVCVKSPVADYPQLSTAKHVIHTKGLGPIGWNEAILSILDGSEQTPFYGA